MPATLVHLVRHGEVHNPDGILYGRLPGFRLSDRGQRMAQLAADSLAGHDIRAIRASPLQRTRESAAPWEARFGLELVADERIIEADNRFEGVNIRRELRRNPLKVRYLINPRRPSWGEPFTVIRDRMLAAVADAFEVAEAADGGEVVLVSHQAPIWITSRAVRGLPLATDPRSRRCALSSITTLGRDGDRIVEVGYAEPAAALLADAIDLGAV